jgi:hypothetical protein
MRLNKTVGLLAGTTALTLGGFCYGNTDEANTSALAQIAELKAELAAMKAQQGEEWLTEQRAADIRGIVQDVLADAETRTSLQSSGATAGYDNGFFISSADGNFRLNINGLMQFRWILNGAGGQNTDWGFGVRRAQVNFSGVFASDWKYALQIQYGSPFNLASTGAFVPVVDPNTGNVVGASLTGGGVNVLDAWVEREVDLGGTTFTLKGGQFKAPFLREWLVGDGDQLAVDRSLTSYYFSQGYSTGLQLGYSADAFRAMVAYTNGVGTPADFTTGSYDTSWISNPTRYSFAGRADVKLSGNWSDFDSFSSRPGTEGGLMIGGAAFYQNYNNNAIGASNDLTALGLTADVTWNFGGASLFASFVWENLDPQVGNSNNPWGFTLQGGYFLSDQFELFGRYSYANADVPNGGDVTKLSLVTFGVNYYMADNAKFTADFGWSLNQLGTFAASGSGYRPDVANEDNQYAIRTQLQLSF